MSSESDSHVQKTLDEVTAFMKIMAQDQQRMWCTMGRSNLFSTDGRSLYSKPGESLYPVEDVNTRTPRKSNVDPPSGFSFDHELKSSAPYRRTHETDQNANIDDQHSFLTIEDVSDILNLALPLETSETHKSIIKRHAEVQNSPISVLTPASSLTQVEANSKSRNLFVMWLTSRDEALADTSAEIERKDLEDIPEDDLSRQKAIHRTIHDEITYHRDLGLFIAVYRRHSKIFEATGPSNLDFEAFMKTLGIIFESFDKLRILHEELLGPLITCAVRESPSIQSRSISDIYNEWIPKARKQYLDFTTIYCDARADIRRASRQCVVTRQYLKLCFKDTQSDGRHWRVFLKRPITNMQRMAARETFARTGSAGDDSYSIDLGLSESRSGDISFKQGPTYSSLPFLQLSQLIRSGLGAETLYQPIKHFRRRLDVTPELAEWIPRLKNTKRRSTIRQCGDLALVNANGFRDFYVVILDDYMLLTERKQIGSEAPLEAKLEHESYRVRYLLSVDVGLVLPKVGFFLPQ